MAKRRFKLFDPERSGLDFLEDLPAKGIKRFFFLYLANFWKLTTAGFWSLLLSLPILTSGLGSVGLTYVARNAVLENHIFGTIDFFEAVKKNWKQALLAGIINLATFAVLGYLAGMCYVNTQKWAMVFVLLFVVELILFVGFVQYYAWHIIITFQTPLTSAYVNGIKLAAVGLKRNLLALLALAVCDGLMIAVAFLPVLHIQLLLWLLMLVFFPGFRGYAVSYCVFPVIKKRIIDPYYRENPEKDVELRKSVNMM